MCKIPGLFVDELGQRLLRVSEHGEEHTLRFGQVELREEIEELLADLLITEAKCITEFQLVVLRYQLIQCQRLFSSGQLEECSRFEAPR